MKLTLTINTDNAAFSDGILGLELARILREVANTTESRGVTDTEFTSEFSVILTDINGNSVGTAKHK